MLIFALINIIFYQNDLDIDISCKKKKKKLKDGSAGWRSDIHLTAIYFFNPHSK